MSDSTKTNMNANDFITLLNTHLSPLVDKQRTVLVSYSAGFSPGPGRGSISINFINLPLERHKQQRGNGAESENNRQLFIVWGFDTTPESPVAKLKLEQSTNGIGARGVWAPRIRAKTGSPAIVAAYLAKYINTIASMFEPNYTHE